MDIIQYPKGEINMTYQEFRETYKNVLKKYYEASNLFDNAYKITLKEERFQKIGSRWKKIEEKEKEVDYTYYFNVFDSIQFFENLGGYERTEKAYTIAGYIPTMQTSISPDRTRKTVFTFEISR